MMKKYLILALFSVAVFLVLSQDKKENYVDIAGQRVQVEVARTEAEKNRGLSGRASLEENEGMLFVFENPGIYPFWMKDMNFPIDIIWIAQDLQVVYIQKDAAPESYPASFDPGVDAKYVLEVVSGFSEKNNLKVGDRALFTY
jgi:hypothetical protein